MSGYKVPLSVTWVGGPKGHLRMVDQTLLPVRLAEIDLGDVEGVFESIVSLRIRGAPAIGIAGAFGLLVATRDAVCPNTFQKQLQIAAERLNSSRPTAVNLSWAIGRMLNRFEKSISLRPFEEWQGLLLEEAQRIQSEDHAMCLAMGDHGQDLIQDGYGVLTHCNAGGLATAAYGTALAVVYRAHEKGRNFRVYADETRPLLQGARLTAWELDQAGIPVTLICDNMAAQVMKEGKIQMVIVGADRIAANGDTANKIGTYGVACLARAHNIPFYVAAPSSTFDLSLPDGSGIPIEQRQPSEVANYQGKQTAPHGVDVYNPAFDVTPAGLICGIITEKGRIEPVNSTIIAEVLRKK